MKAPLTDEDFRKEIARERRSALSVAKAFANAAEAGDVEAFYQAVDMMPCAVDSWRLAFKKVARLPAVPDPIRDAFLPVWIESKMLPLRVGNRRVLAHALRVLLPKCEIECPLRLFRGAGSNERRRRIYGFSWTTHLDVARGFAEHWQPVERDGVVFSEDGGVVLETTAPADAVLLVREDPDYYDESEVVVDPFHLGRVSLLERLTTPQFRPA